MQKTDTSITRTWDADTDAICAVVLETVARAKDIDPLHIDTPLYDAIDPDALDRLFLASSPGPRPSHCRLTFRYEDCEVTVDSEGTISARPVDDVRTARPAAAPTVEAGPAPE